MRKKLAAMLLSVVMAVGFLPLSACNGGRKDTAASMHLRRTEGTVSVSDGSGKDVPLLDNLGLYSGYGVGTQSASYAWIDLDDVKLAKLDQKSEISIEQEGKALNIELKSGNLFFNVTKPLEDDETMNIRTSTMTLGIRGTCGWVEENGGLSRVYLLEGKVKCTAGGWAVEVNAGEMAEFTEDGYLIVEPFTAKDVPAFVVDEVAADNSLAQAILEAFGLDILDPLDPAERLRAEYMDIINSRPILDEYASGGTVYTANGLTYASEGLSYAAIVDFDGNGTDELVLVTQYGPRSLTKLEVYGDSQGHAALYGEADLLKFWEEDGWGDVDAYYAPSDFWLAENNGHIYAVVMYGIQDVKGSLVYTVENNELTLVERTGYGGYVGDQYATNWVLTVEQNICPPLPDDARMKNTFSSFLDTYASPQYYDFAKWVNKDLYRFDYDGTLEKFSWNGTEAERTVLEENIIYAKLIDMDQDGEEELILITEDYQAVAYSWKGASCERILLYDEAFEEYEGFYRDTVTGDIYLGILQWWDIGWGRSLVYRSLTDRVEYFIEFGNLIEDYNRDPTPAKWEAIEEAQAEFDRKVARFESIENIHDLSGISYESFNQLWYTVNETLQQLAER